MFYLSDTRRCTGKHTFMQQHFDNRHPTFCIALASQLFEQRDPDVESVKKILRTKGQVFIHDAKCDGCRRLSDGDVFSVFIDLFERQKLARSMLACIFDRLQ